MTKCIVQLLQLVTTCVTTTMNGITKKDLTNVLTIVIVMVKEPVSQDIVMEMPDQKIMDVKVSQMKITMLNMIALVTKTVIMLLSILNVTIKVTF